LDGELAVGIGEYKIGEKVILEAWASERYYYLKGCGEAKVFKHMNLAMEI
jgi:hypothetical protein